MKSLANTSVAVVIPAHDASVFIERAIESVWAQSRAVDEIVVVDDASEDQTSEIVRRLAARDPRIRLLVNSSNLGPGPSRNIAWDNVTAEFVAFLDADDTWETDKIRFQLEWFEKNPYELLCATSHRISGELPRIQSSSEVSQFTLKDLLIKNRFTTPSVMLRRGIPYRFDERALLSEDYLLWMEIAAKQGHVSRLNRPLTILHKPIYGASGLSSQSVPMFINELRTFGLLRDKRLISSTQRLAASVWSTVKFIRRAPTSYLRQKKWSR